MTDFAAFDDDITLDRITLDGRKLDARIASVITGATIERTIEGASTLTLTLFDPQRELLRSGIFDGAVDLELDGLWFRLVKVAKAGDVLTVTFEDRAVAYLRRHSSYRKARRDTFTRAEFAYALVMEVAAVYRPRFISPELHKRQPIRGTEKQRASRDRRRERGISDGARLPIGPGSNPPNADRRQRDQMERALGVAQREKAGSKATLALLVAGIGESNFRPVPNTEGSGYAGVFQASPANIPMHDTEEQARSFLRGGKGFQQGGAIYQAKHYPSRSVGDMATRIEASGKPPAFYDKFRDQAEKILAAWGGAVTVGGGREKPFEFTRGEPGKREDTWTALGRLADEVGWRRFMVGNDLFFMSEADLFRSRPRMALREDTPGVQAIDFDFDYGKDVAELRVACRMSRWQAPPGSVVEVEGQGPANGRYLVAGISRSLFDRAAGVTLKAPMRERPEPAAERVNVSRSGRSVREIGGPVRDRIVRAAEWALDHKTAYHYSQSGPVLPDLKSRPVAGHRFDCSWFVTLCYKTAEAPDPNGGGFDDGYTGTLRAHGRRTTSPRPGDLAHYGGGTGRHVALYIGDGKCIGIGSEAVGINRHDARYASDFAGYWTHDLD